MVKTLYSILHRSLDLTIISALFAKYNISVVFASVGIVLVMFTSIFYILFLKTINKKISN